MESRRTLERRRITMVGLGHLTEMMRHTKRGRMNGRMTQPAHDGNAAFRLILLRSARPDGQLRDEIIRCSRELRQMLGGRPAVLVGDATYRSRRVSETAAALSAALQRTAPMPTGQQVYLEEAVREGRPALVDMLREYEQYGYDVVVVTHLLIIHMMAHEVGAPLLPRWSSETLSPAEPVMFRAQLRDGELERLSYEPDPLGVMT